MNTTMFFFWGNFPWIFQSTMLHESQYSLYQCTIVLPFDGTGISTVHFHQQKKTTTPQHYPWWRHSNITMIHVPKNKNTMLILWKSFECLNHTVITSVMLNWQLQPPLKLQGKFSHINECKDHELYSLSENPPVKIRLQVISVRGREAAFPGCEGKYSGSQCPERER